MDMNLFNRENSNTAGALLAAAGSAALPFGLVPDSDIGWRRPSIDQLGALLDDAT